jgi:hypothetical protein
MSSKDKPKNITTTTQLQYDNVSPATKLLEKRRNMYEVHEAFELQKDEYKKYAIFNSEMKKISRI